MNRASLIGGCMGLFMAVLSACSSGGGEVEQPKVQAFVKQVIPQQDTLPPMEVSVFAHIDSGLSINPMQIDSLWVRNSNTLGVVQRIISPSRNYILSSDQRPVLRLLDVDMDGFLDIELYAGLEEYNYWLYRLDYKRFESDSLFSGGGQVHPEPQSRTILVKEEVEATELWPKRSNTRNEYTYKVGQQRIELKGRKQIRWIHYQLYEKMLFVPESANYGELREGKGWKQVKSQLYRKREGFPDEEVVDALYASQEEIQAWLSSLGSKIFVSVDIDGDVLLKAGQNCLEWKITLSPDELWFDYGMDGDPITIDSVRVFDNGWKTRVWFRTSAGDQYAEPHEITFDYTKRPFLFTFDSYLLYEEEPDRAFIAFHDHESYDKYGEDCEGEGE